MAGVVNLSGAVTCNHGGAAELKSAAKLTVSSQAVLLAADVPKLSGLATACSTPASSSTKPCTVVVSISVGPAGKLTAGSQPVLLETLVGVTDGVAGGPGKASATAGETKLTAS